MNDKDLRDLFAAPDELEPLNPAAIIAGAHRRRRRRDLFAGGVAAVAVLAVAVGSLVAVTHSNTGAPAKPPVAGVTSPAPTKPTSPKLPPGKATKLTTAACLSAYAGQAPNAPTSKAQVIGTVDGAEGRLMVVADSKYFGVCENSYGSEPSIREAARIKRPTTSDSDAFAVANDGIDNAQGQTHEFYWGGGLLPRGVAGVRYIFPDGKTVDAKVFGEYWAVRYLSTSLRVIGQGPPGRVAVRLIGADGSVVKEFKLVDGTQTCAQISHGC
jgi:hypothetical protein